MTFAIRSRAIRGHAVISSVFDKPNFVVGLVTVHAPGSLFEVSREFPVWGSRSVARAFATAWAWFAFRRQVGAVRALYKILDKHEKYGGNG